MKDVPTFFGVLLHFQRDAMSVVIVSDIMITYKDVFNNDDDGESFSLKNIVRFIEPTFAVPSCTL